MWGPPGGDKKEARGRDLETYFPDPCCKLTSGFISQMKSIVFLKASDCTAFLSETGTFPPLWTMDDNSSACTKSWMLFALRSLTSTCLLEKKKILIELLSFNRIYLICIRTLTDTSPIPILLYLSSVLDLALFI